LYHGKLSDNNVVLIYTEEACVSNARNIGIKQSKGDFLCFIDDDDIVSENYLLKMYSIAIKDILPLSYIKNFRKTIMDNEDSYITKLYERNINKEIKLSNTRSFFSVPYCKLIRKNTIGNEVFNKKFQNGEDSLFMFAISDRIKKLNLQIRAQYIIIECVKML
jgi:glycosyltransferase involved in cell wall biosynthesis